jgi:hypothetical protein
VFETRMARVNLPVAGAPELRPVALSAELGSEGRAFTTPSGGQTPPQGAGLRPAVKVRLIHDYPCPILSS